MTPIIHPDGNQSKRDAQLDAWQNCRDKIIEAIKEKKRPVRASEVKGCSPVQIGKCVDRYYNTFRRVFGGHANRSHTTPSHIGLHPDLARDAEGYDEFGHLTKWRKP